MNRRTVLARASAGLVGGLSGCLSEDVPDSDDTSGTETPSNDDASTEMRLSLTSVDDGLEPLIFSVTVVEDQLTSSTVPLLDISVENTGDDPVTWLYAPNTGLPSEVVYPCTESVPDKLTIGHEDELTRLLVEDGDCARTEREIDRAQAPKATELGPGNTLEQRYAIAGNEEKIDGHCPPVDTYRVGCMYHHSDPIEEFGRWGFNIELRSQDS